MQHQRGTVMLVAMLLLTGLVYIAGTSAIRSVRQDQVSTVDYDHTRAFYAAEAAIEQGALDLREELENVIDPTQAQLDAMADPTVTGMEISSFTITKTGPLTQETLTSGDYQGLIGFVQRYDLNARAQGGRRGATVTREIQHQFIPLFQFGVFYEDDLEIFPGPAMTFIGPIHTNSNLFMGAVTSIACNSTVTVVGNYYHYRKANGVDEVGPVTVFDVAGVAQNVWRGTYWLDERQATWQQDALALWGGTFRDQAHGLNTLRLPLPPATNQHVIIERGVAGDGTQERSQKYWYKATRRYVDGAITDSSGAAVAMPGVFTLVNDDFWDDREDRDVDALNINVANMIANGCVPPNGILYVTHATGNRRVVRITNAGTLPTGGLTIATDLPVYIQGHYNNVAKKGSAILCDAITLLSPNWNDANSHLALNSRVPTALTVNACFMAGHVETTGSDYSGGLENSFRFLEKWGGITVTFRGSIINLWFSQINTALWGGSYYQAPNRNWGFDTDLLQPGNWPPGTPRVQTVQRGAWRQVS
jgi:hypothetical protein